MTSVEIERLVLRSGSWRGWYFADKCLPAARSCCSFQMKTAWSDQWVAFACQPQSKCHLCCHTWHEARTRPQSNLDASLWVGPMPGKPPRLFSLYGGDVKHEGDAAEKVAFMSTKAIIKDALINFIPFQCGFFSRNRKITTKVPVSPQWDSHFLNVNLFPSVNCAGKCPELLFCIWRCLALIDTTFVGTGRKWGWNRWTFRCGRLPTPFKPTHPGRKCELCND